MTDYDALSPIDPATGRVTAVIDTPKGSRGKYKYAADTGLFRLNKLLPVGAYFPYNFGFIPGTKAEDGDALDVLVIMEEPVHIGATLSVRIIGVLRAEQTETDGRIFRNDRLLAVLDTPQNPPEFNHYRDLPPRRLAEIEHFFLSYNLMEGRAFKSLGPAGPQEALQLIEAHRAGHPAA
jgi:inorganic pyrophosphatase